MQLPTSLQILLAGLLSTGALAGDLHQLAKAAGKLYFGTAIDNGEIDDAAYKAIVSDAGDYGQITAGNTQKWQFTEPSQGQFEFAKGDVISDFAEANGQILRCHTLVWHSQLPSWVSSGSWTKEQLTEIINTHIENEVGHWKGKCYAWDVVNEALNDDATYRDDVFFKVLGTDYLPIAFKAAAAADPDAKLYYNDYNIEHSGPKQKAALEIVDLIQAAGAKIDGVGLQGHFIVGNTPSRTDLAAVLNSFVAKGVEVAYTEIDVRFQSLPPAAGGYDKQATDYGNIVGACLDVKECVGVTVWGVSDKYSWIPQTFSGNGEACIYSEAMEPKPAYEKIREVLAAAGGSGSAPAPSSSAPATVPSSSSRSAAAPTSTKAGSAPTTTSAAPSSSKSAVQSSSSKAPATTKNGNATVPAPTTLATSSRTATAPSSKVPTTTARPTCNSRRRRRRAAAPIA